MTVHIDEVFTHILKPFPSSIGQSEKQLVVYEGNHYVYMPYTVKRQTTTVKLASSKVESNTKLKPTSVSDSIITYGPYSNVKPFSADAMKIHYENNSPFVAVSLHFQYKFLLSVNISFTVCGHFLVLLQVLTECASNQSP